MTAPSPRSLAVAVLHALLALGCSAGGLAPGHRASPPGSGPVIRWDIAADPLPEVPLPNDVATWPDPTSPTGRRVNASMVAPTVFESRLRERFDQLDGWGTYMPITVGFDAPIDTEDMIDRQGRGRMSQDDWQRHAVYLVALDTGIPVPLDVNSGSIPLTAADPDGYYSNDPRAGGSNLLFETVEEDLDGDGVLDPGEDTDFDGVLDHPNTRDGRLTGDRYETHDRMLWFYERQSDLLMLRPLVPLRENTRYAVVLTDRLRGRDGQPVRSPFGWVHHVSQYEALAVLPRLLAERPHVYGRDLADSGFEHVAFAWTFTTQSIRRDLVALRDGLYGRGPFARLAEEFPARLTPAPMLGGTRAFPCEIAEEDGLYVVRPDQIKSVLAMLPLESFGAGAEQIQAVLDSLDSIDHFAYGFFESPYLLGDPDAEDLDDAWEIDARTGEGTFRRDLVPMVISVPRRTETRRQPFPVTFYAHGYGLLNLESIAFAGITAQQGIATVSIDAQGHGLPLDPGILGLLDSVLGQNCLSGFGRALAIDRARDLNADRVNDSAGYFFSAYMFHTRDTLRQTALDWMQAVRIVRGFLGHPDYPDGRPWVPGQIEPRVPRAEPLVFDGDTSGDGVADLAGDFDGDGVPDIGGWHGRYGMWGSSLGGIVTMIMMGLEPALVAGAPVSGGAGLFDIGLRTDLGTAQHPVWLRTIGPVLSGVPRDTPSDETGCAAPGGRSVRFEVPDLNNQLRVEIACLPEEELRAGDAVVLHNVANDERRCAAVGEGGAFRIDYPADAGDPLRIEIYRDAARAMRYGDDCALEEPRDLVRVLDTWQSQRGAPGAGRCSKCATYAGVDFEAGSPLVSVTSGLGLSRQTPDLRRLAALSQMAIDPGDPINYAPHVFLDPATAPDVPARTRNILVISTAGDTTVPVSTGNAYARAAGVLPFLPADAPPELAEYRAPPWFEATYDAPTPNDVLIDRHVLEGLDWLERHPVPGAPRFLFDVDDMSEGRQAFVAGGGRQATADEEGFVPNRLDPPLRWRRDSRPVVDAREDPWRRDRGFEGVSGLLNVVILPRGNHVILPVDPAKAFDEGEYMLNTIGWYLVSGGTELPYEIDPLGHHCLETSACRIDDPR